MGKKSRVKKLKSENLKKELLESKNESKKLVGKSPTLITTTNSFVMQCAKFKILFLSVLFILLMIMAWLL